MKLRKRSRAQTPNTPKFEARAQRLSPSELTEGIEQCITNMNAYWPEWRRSKDRAILEEFLLTVEAAYILGDYLAAADDRPPIIQKARQMTPSWRNVGAGGGRTTKGRY